MHCGLWAFFICDLLLFDIYFHPSFLDFVPCRCLTETLCCTIRASSRSNLVQRSRPLLRWLTSSCLNMCALDVPQPVAFSSPSCLFLSRSSRVQYPLFSTLCYLKRTIPPSTLWLFKIVYSPQPRVGYCVKSFGMHRQKPHTAGLTYGKIRSLHRKTTKWIHKLEIGIFCDKLLSHLTD